MFGYFGVFEYLGILECLREVVLGGGSTAAGCGYWAVGRG